MLWTRLHFPVLNGNSKRQEEKRMHLKFQDMMCRFREESNRQTSCQSEQLSQSYQCFRRFPFTNHVHWWTAALEGLPLSLWQTSSYRTEPAGPIRDTQAAGALTAQFRGCHKMYISIHSISLKQNTANFRPESARAMKINQSPLSKISQSTGRGRHINRQF